VSGPDVEQTGQPGARESGQLHAALKRAARNYLDQHLNGHAAWADADDLIHALADPIAALVAAAEERGFDRGVRAAGGGPALAAVRAEAEWRGAEKERERCAEQLERFAGRLNREDTYYDIAARLTTAARELRGSS
jgi:hypothetical protein